MYELALDIHFDDVTVVAGAIQAAAAVIAVLTGWLLSALTERRAWKRRKLEQVREKQIETLMQIGSLAIDAIDQSEAISTLHTTLVATSSGADVGRDLIVRETQRALADCADSLASITTQVKICKVGLQILRFRADTLQIVASLVADMDRLTGISRGLTASTPTTVLEVSEAVSAIRAQSDRVLSEGIDGVST